jgi:prepilin-type N-terminal cleavage/methylation domain-containing protein
MAWLQLHALEPPSTAGPGKLMTQICTIDAPPRLVESSRLADKYRMLCPFPPRTPDSGSPNDRRPAAGNLGLAGRGPSAFSLMEILVVIAIIAVLAALAIGPLQAMIKRGHAAKTAANMKQIGAAMHVYAADSGGFLPSDMASGGPFWIKELWQIIYPDKPYKPMTSQQHGDHFKGTVFHTPAIEKVASDGKLPRSFAANARVRVHSVGSYNSTRDNARAHLASIPFPAKAFFLAESVSSVQVDFPSRDTQLNFRNDGRGWFLFVDGHLESLRREDVPDDRDHAFWGGPKPPAP